MQEYGKTIKRIRKQKGLTLKQFSQETGLSVSFLSKIECGVNNPSFTNLQKICYALGVSSSVFEEPAEDPGREKPLFIPKDQRHLVYAYGSGIKMESLFSQNAFEVNVLTIASGKTTPSSARHRKSEFGIVLRGTLRIKMNGEEYLLSPEDAIRIPAGVEHLTEKIGTEECVSIWVKYD